MTYDLNNFLPCASDKVFDDYANYFTELYSKATDADALNARFCDLAEMWESNMKELATYKGEAVEILRKRARREWFIGLINHEMTCIQKALRRLAA